MATTDIVRLEKLEQFGFPISKVVASWSIGVLQGKIKINVETFPCLNIYFDHENGVTQGRLKSGILTRYACATKNNALGYEKIIVISFVGMQKLWIYAKFHERGSKNTACHAH